MAVAGPLAAVAPPDTLSDGEMDSHVLPALRAARAARDRGPLLAGPHLRLGAYSRMFARTEPAAVHFERAKRVGGWDPDVWYLSGVAALARGDADAAWADWRESLRRDPRRLGAVVRAADQRIPPEEIRDRILTDDPVLWVAATDELDLDADGRRAWLQAAADRWQARSRAGAVPGTEAEWLAWGTTLERLKQHDAALGIWLRAIERLPESVPLRDRLVVRLEGGERYEEAIAHLDWLLAHKPEDGRVRVRHEAARHAIKLKREIEGR
jgi:tetratricopeptide (TPR) repeat protein